MKKYIVLTILFILPLVAYLFFASGVNNFAKLPVIKQNVDNISNYSKIGFDNKISEINLDPSLAPCSGLLIQHSHSRTCMSKILNSKIKLIGASYTNKFITLNNCS